VNIFCGLNFVKLILCAISNSILVCFIAYKFLQIFQLLNYKSANFLKTLFNKNSKTLIRVLILSLITIYCTMATYILLERHSGEFLNYLPILYYIYFFSVYIYDIHKENKKIKLKYTSRVVRLLICFGLIIAINTLVLVAISFTILSHLQYIILAITPILIPLQILLANMLLQPIELLIKRFYIIKAKRKLAGLKNLIKIGITGSYGKTSTKFILKTLLDEKYKVCVTPASFNTPMGITKTILNALLPDTDIFIAEMGARHSGDIRYLCELIKPEHAILTSIGNQHLETFKTIENITHTKYELIENLSVNGIAVFNGNDKLVKSLYEKTNLSGKIYTALNDKQAFISAENVVVTENGTTFDLNIDKNIITCHTLLLGEHNIENLIMAVALSYKLGLSIKEIINGIDKIKPIEHRLELIKTESGVIILDDSYNASVVGTEQALKVLSKFNHRRVVMTPGIIELGSIEKQENYKLGSKIATVADLVLIVNKIHSQEIKQGLIDSGFNKKNILKFDTLISAQTEFKNILNAGDVLLIMNDLPDNFI
jgi:UDP-N-acetylmuramoyl-tripeptide--D-alanyl-D-alanine ligase